MVMILFWIIIYNRAGLVPRPVGWITHGDDVEISSHRGNYLFLFNNLDNLVSLLGYVHIVFFCRIGILEYVIAGYSRFELNE